MSLMNIDIRGLGIFCTTALSDHARRRLQFALARYGDRIQRVTLRLGNEHGPRGEFNKFCRIQVHLTGAPVVLIRDVGHDLHTVIDRAADQAGRAVVKHLHSVSCTTDGPAAATGLVANEEPRT